MTNTISTSLLCFVCFVCFRLYFVLLVIGCGSRTPAVRLFTMRDWVMVRDHVFDSDVCSSFKWFKLFKLCRSWISCRNGLSPTWIFMWLLRVLDWRNCFLQTAHSNGFSPVWIFWWLVNVLSCRNNLWQNVHENGFSPVWIFAWFVNVLDCRNFLSHIWHLNGFSPVWILKWLVNVLNWRNCFSHIAHWKGFSPLTVIVIARLNALDISSNGDGATMSNRIRKARGGQLLDCLFWFDSVCAISLF